VAARVVAIVYRVLKIGLIVLAVAVLLGVVFTRLPTNPANVIVRNVLHLARTLAGPFRDVFRIKNPKDALTVNYGLAAVVYLLLAVLVGRLPTGKR
jgi:large-conductance mechanosensitive channel